MISVALVLMMMLAGLANLCHDNQASKLIVSFVNAEPSYGPAFSNVECERLAFAVRNNGKLAVPFVVTDIKDAHGIWVGSFQKLDDAGAGGTTQLYLYVPKDSHPQAVRLRGYKKASPLEKARFALTLLIKKSSIRGKVWFENLSLPAYEFTVNVEKPNQRPQ